MSSSKAVGTVCTSGAVGTERVVSASGVVGTGCVVGGVVIVAVMGGSTGGGSAGSSGSSPGSGVSVVLGDTLVLKTSVAKAAVVYAVSGNLVVLVLVSSQCRSSCGSGAGSSSALAGARVMMAVDTTLVLVLVLVVLVSGNCSTASGSSADGCLTGAVAVVMAVANSRLVSVAKVLVVLVGATLKFVVAVVTRAVGKASLLPGELFESLDGKSGSLVVDRLGVVRFVNGNRGVNNMRLDGILLNNRLNVLVNVVVHSLTSDDGGSGRSVGGLMCSRSVLELCVFPIKSVLGFSLVSVVKSLVCDGDNVVVVLLGTGNGLD